MEGGRVDLRLRVQTLCASIVTSCEALVALFLEGSSFLYRHVSLGRPDRVLMLYLDLRGQTKDKAWTNYC